MIYMMNQYKSLPAFCESVCVCVRHSFDSRSVYYIYILGPGELGFSCSRQLGSPWGGLLTLVLPRLKLYFFNGSSRDVIGVTYASRSYLMFFPNIHKEPQVTHHANFKSRERHDRADYMS